MSINKYTKEETEFLLKNYSAMGVDFCFERLKTKTKDSIRRKAFYLNIKISDELKKQRPIKAGVNRRNRTLEKHENFNNSFVINDDKTAYFLGFLWADGHLYGKEGYYMQTHITMSKGDYDDLVRYFPEGLGNFLYYEQKQKNEKHKTKIYFRLQNPSFAYFLYKHDYKNKSVNSPEKILNKIPKPLRKFFWLGFFDGDGCFYVGKNGSSFSVSGRIEQDWGCLEELTKLLNIKSYSIDRRINKNRNSKCSVYRIWRKEDIKILINYLYNDTTLGLKRKRLKANLILLK
jgi:hypothetical protein